MPRPRHCRYVEGNHAAKYFKPRGIPMSELAEVELSVEGLEAIRLADMEGLTCTDAASRMRISRFTFGRVLTEARRLVAQALIEGKALHITGGNYEVLGAKNSNNQEEEMNIIAVSSEGPGLESMVDPRFGRAGGFVILNKTTDEVSYIDNGASQVMAQGAGIETAERLSEAGVEVVLSGFVGPKAFEALQEAEIKVVQDMDGMSAGDAIQKFLSGQASFANSPNKK